MARTYIIHGEEWTGEYFEKSVLEIQKLNWEFKRHTSGPSLDYIKKGKVQSSREYTGQDYDPEKYVLDPKGWNHDHCEVCWWTIAESEEQDIGFGYTDGNGLWICQECYNLFIDEKT